MFKKRPLTLALAALAIAGSTVATSVPADAAGYSTGGAIGALYKTQVRTLGAPTSNEYTGHADRVQSFRYGLIYWSSATGAHSVSGGILSEYKSQGYDAGRLGLPLTEEKATPGGAYQQFKGGTIYWSSAAGAHSVGGGILSEYKRQGSDAGQLGLPVTGEMATVGGGVYQQFKGGIIYWTPSGGAHAIQGAIRTLYAQSGAERGQLGFPTSSEVSTSIAGASFVYQNFEHGMISWNGVRVAVYNDDPGNAHVVVGDFYKEYLAAGGVKVVGYISGNQVSGQIDGVSGAVPVAGQWFQNGGIFYKAGAGVHYLPNAWLTGISASDLDALGYPTSGVNAVAGATAVDFENGSVARGADGKFTVTLSTPSPSPTATPGPLQTVQSEPLKGSTVPSPAGRAGITR